MIDPSGLAKGGKQRSGGNDPLYSKTCEELWALFKCATGAEKSKLKKVLKLKKCDGSGSSAGKPKPKLVPIPSPPPVAIPRPISPIEPVQPEPIGPMPVDPFPIEFDPLPV